jgi:hypothetical protein
LERQVTSKKNKKQGFLPAELLLFIGFGPELISSYNKYIFGQNYIKAD